MNLLQAVTDHFDEQELKSLCFDLGIDFDALRGDGKTAKARELIAFIVRRGQHEELLQVLKKERPKVGWENIPFPPPPLRDQLFQADKRLVLAGIFGVFILGALLWLLLRPKISWTPGEPVDEALFGIAIAEFTVGADQERSEQGREMSELLYQQLENLLRQQPGLAGRVALTRVGVVRDGEEAKETGERVNADLVLWGWIPEFSGEAVVPNFTILDEKVLSDDSPLLQSVSLMISGPGTIRLIQLSGRTLALSRFIIGYIYLRSDSESDYRRALEMFELGITELEKDLEKVIALVDEADNLEQRLALEDAQEVFRKTLAIFYTAKGIAHAALSEPDLAVDSYEVALTFDENYSRVYLALGSYYYNERQFKEALSMFEKARSLEPDNPSVYYSLGLISYYQSNYETAVNYFHETIRLTKDDGEPVLAYLGSGYAYKQLGQLENAREAFQMVVDSQSATDEIREGAAQEIRFISDLTPTPISTTALPIITPTPTFALLSSPMLIPTPTTTRGPLTPVPELRIIVAYATLRSGPGTNYNLTDLDYLEQGTVVLVLAKNQDGSWYNVELANGTHGWLSKEVSEPVSPYLMTRVPVALTISATLLPTLQLQPTEPPPTAPPTATLLPTATPVLLPTAPPTIEPTSTAQSPTETPVSTQTIP